MRLSTDRVREAILHEDSKVRSIALEYFADSFSTDPLVMPVVIRAVEKYGMKSFIRSDRLTQLVQTDETLNWALGRIQSGHSEPLHDSNPWERLVVWSDMELLAPREPDILSTPRLSGWARRALRYRLELRTQPPESLKGKLEAECAELDRLDDYPDQEKLDSIDHLVMALAKFPEYAAQLALAILEKPSRPENGWIEFFAIRLVRHLRLKEAIPHLVDRLHLDDDSILEEAHPALAAIGSDEVIDRILTDWPQAEWTFRFMSSCVLNDLHSDRSVETALKLAADEKDLHLKVRLLEAILCNFDPAGVEPALQLLLSSSPDLVVNDLEYTLVNTCILMNETFPELSSWKARYDERRKRLERQLELLKHPPPMPSVERPTPVGTFMRTEQHVGRNDPCPCGSGRKFKKCCGAG